MALFRMAFFRLFALIFRHFAWRISFFRLFAWRYFVFSLFRLVFFRYFVFSLGVISSWRRAITPGETRKNEITKWHKQATILQRSAFGWYVVCECGISLSYSAAFGIELKINFISCIIAAKMLFMVSHFGKKSMIP